MGSSAYISVPCNIPVYVLCMPSQGAEVDGVLYLIADYISILFLNSVVVVAYAEV